MGRSQNSFMKKQREKKKQKKKEEKVQRKQERQENAGGGSLDEMIAYVDEFGNILSEPPKEENLTAAQKKNPNSDDPLK